MSRIGKKVIAVPKDVTVTVHDRELEVKGPKGTLKTPIPQGISFKLEGEELREESPSLFRCCSQRTDAYLAEARCSQRRVLLSRVQRNS